MPQHLTESYTGWFRQYLISLADDYTSLKLNEREAICSLWDSLNATIAAAGKTDSYFCRKVEEAFCLAIDEIISRGLHLPPPYNQTMRHTGILPVKDLVATPELRMWSAWALTRMSNMDAWYVVSAMLVSSALYDVSGGRLANSVVVPDLLRSGTSEQIDVTGKLVPLASTFGEVILAVGIASNATRLNEVRFGGGLRTAEEPLRALLPGLALLFTNWPEKTTAELLEVAGLCELHNSTFPYALLAIHKLLKTTEASIHDLVYRADPVVLEKITGHVLRFMGDSTYGHIAEEVISLLRRTGVINDALLTL